MRCTIKDIEAVERVLKDDSIYPYVIDDSCTGDFSASGFLENRNIYLLMPIEEAVFIASPINGTTYDFHVNILKESRGLVGDAAFREAVNYIFGETPCEKLLSYIAVCFPNVKAHSERMGLVQEGYLTKSIKRGGKLHDQYIVSMNKDSWRKLWQH